MKNPGRTNMPHVASGMEQTTINLQNIASSNEPICNGGELHPTDSTLTGQTDNGWKRFERPEPKLNTLNEGRPSEKNIERRTAN
jgi:hypothetical protein